MRRNHSIWQVMLVLLLLGCARVSASVTLEALLGTLREHGVPFDTNAVERAAVRAALSAIDPGASLTDTNAPTVEPAEGRHAVALAETWNAGIHYLKLNGLYADSAEAILTILRDWLAADGRHGLIIDLRGAGGGGLAAVDGLAAVLDPSLSALYEVRDGAGNVLETHYGATNVGFRIEWPVMLLMDADTVEAAQLLTGVVKGHDGVMLLGCPTRGDRRLRERLSVTECCSIEVGTRWLFLSGHADTETLEVSPDVVINGPAVGMPVSADVHDQRGRERSEKAKRDMELMQRVAGDSVLARAADILLALKALDVHGGEAPQDTASQPGN